MSELASESLNTVSANAPTTRGDERGRSVLVVAIGTTRSRAVTDTTEFLLARGVDVDLLTVEAESWQAAGLDPRVRLHTLAAAEEKHPLAVLGRLVRRVSKAAYTKGYAKVYRLLRPYVMWRAARTTVVRKLDWNTVEQLVICDSHAIPIGWHLAKRHPKLTVGFELDRAPFAALPATADRKPVLTATTPAPRPLISTPAGIDVVDG
jgi:hypothetical protein